MPVTQLQQPLGILTTHLFQNLKMKMTHNRAAPAATPIAVLRKNIEDGAKFNKYYKNVFVRCSYFHDKTAADEKGS